MEAPRTLPMTPVLAALLVALWAMVNFMRPHESPLAPDPRAARIAGEQDGGPLWEDGEVVHDARTGEPITWRREQ